jgi:hypothetical protein
MFNLSPGLIGLARRLKLFDRLTFVPRFNFGVSLWELLRLTDDEGMSLSPGTFKEFEVCSSVRKIYTFYEKKYSIFDDDWSPFFFHDLHYRFR